ncbi:MAG TPA: hypothetical protein PKC13_18775 [Blastocatellia bacterium]|nr:hypothetical protein [Blastocatellia bacterium]HMX27643.1 hypothetical protein [Blastocatellia bacterium]HNG31077.1 hypothetical protein [Blastocatellia bacterium]
MTTRFLLILLFFSSVITSVSFADKPGKEKTSEVPTVTIEAAYPIRLPGADLPEAGIYDGIDSNSPMHWDEKGNFYVFASVRHPYRSSGQGLYQLTPKADRTTIQDSIGVEGGKWLEATWRDDDGTLYGWYHNEPPGVCSNDQHLSAPRIGALISHDEGMTWDDLGIVLEAPSDSLNCETRNFYFAGGNGDFSVMLDQSKTYFYFFFGSYHSRLEEQGVSIARMSYADRNQPAGKLWKWHNGEWHQPGLGGRVTPIFPVMSDWHQANPDAFWGPSIHYNTYLKMYVILLNRAINEYWNQEGVYIAYNDDLSNPSSWTLPDRLPLDPQGMSYPQVAGLAKGGTDKLAGRTARLFLLGHSRWQISFRLDGDEDECVNCVGQTPARPAISSRASLPERQPVRAARPSLLDQSGRTKREPIAPRQINK